MASSAAFRWLGTAACFHDFVQSSLPSLKNDMGSTRKEREKITMAPLSSNI
jgi:hypothetical protein